MQVLAKDNEALYDICFRTLCRGMKLAGKTEARERTKLPLAVGVHAGSRTCGAIVVWRHDVCEN